jgi:hypothetical protein
VFKWEDRKGWDVLIQAFAEEFLEDEFVVLRLRTGSADTEDDIEGNIRHIVTQVRLYDNDNQTFHRPIRA